MLARARGRLDAARLDWIFGLFPRAEAVLDAAGRQPLRRPEADAGDRPRHHRAAAAAADRRADQGAGAGHHRNMIEAFRELKSTTRRSCWSSRTSASRSAGRHGRGDGLRPHRPPGRMAELRGRRRCSSACWDSGVASVSAAMVRPPPQHRTGAACRDAAGLVPLALVPAIALAAFPFIQQPPDLGHAHRRRPRDGHDDLRHGVGPDAGLRPDGRDQFRARRVHHGRRLCRGLRAGGCWPAAMQAVQRRREPRGDGAGRGRGHRRSAGVLGLVLRARHRCARCTAST